MKTIEAEGWPDLEGVTPRRVAAGHEAADLLASILNGTPEAVLIADETLHIVAASDGAERLFGYAAGELIGAGVEQLLPQRLRQDRTALGSAFRSAVRRRARRETFGLRRDGTEFPIEASLSRGAGAGRAYYTVMLRDIAERRRAQARLKASEQRLKIAVRTARLHVFEVDYQTRTLFKAGAEDTFFETPLTFDELALDPFCVLHEADQERARKAWLRHRASGRPFRIESRVRRADGRAVWAVITAELVEDAAGRPLRLIGALRDVTARVDARSQLQRAAEAAQAASVAKSTFLATMSHEIRTPLNGVLGMVQAMGRDELSPPQRARLSIIRESGEALLSILNDVLDLSKIEAGKLDLEEIEFDFLDLLSGAGAAFTPLANAKGLSLAIDVAGAEGIYRGDPTRLRQIVYNLLSNAVKFTHQGQVRLTAERTGAWLRIVVEDTGIGITPEQQETLFRPFSQADASTTRRFGGAGLGLTICRELAARMGGEVSVESRPGAGSTFVLLAPLAYAGPSIASRAADGPEAPMEADRPLRVLAAEDNLTNQLVLRTLLAQAGVEVVVAENGRSAVDAWTQAPFDLVLMDICMPEMDGVQATREIRRLERERGRGRIPVIALTANALDHQVREYLAAGMDRCVTKPIEVALLLSAMEQVLEPEEPMGGKVAAG
ncbi:MAG: PAS domain S-box protein [Caulobacteraceae bacterium]|nr:PAS domain S-box protein [Caulobacteraceae bacterium]